MQPEDVIGILNRKVQNATVTEDQIDAAVEKYHKTIRWKLTKHSLFLMPLQMQKQSGMDWVKR
mgnify:FL=1